MINWVEKVDSDSAKIHNKLIEYVNQLLEQLFNNSEANQSLTDTFKELRNICQIFVQEDRYDQLFVFDLLIIILKDYIKLLDNNQFIQMIDNENLSFLRQFYQVIKIKYIDQCQSLEDLSEKTARDIYLSLFDQMNQSKRFILYLKNQLIDEKNILIHSYHIIFYLILKIFNKIQIFSMKDCQEEYLKNFFQFFLHSIDQYFQQRQYSRFENLLMKELLAFLVNSCRLIFLVPMNYLDKCLHWLTLDYLNTDEHWFVIQMLFFLSFHDDSIHQLKLFHCDEILRDYQTKQLNTKINFLIDHKWSKDVSDIFNLILISIIDFDEFLLNKTNKNILDEFFLTIQSALEQQDSIRIQRRLISLMKLCTNDNLLDYFFHETSNVIRLFKCLKIFLNDFDKNIVHQSVATSAILALANILWSLSFHEQYHRYLFSYNFLLKKLEDYHQNGIFDEFISRIYIPSQMFLFSRTIDGIRYNLNPSTKNEMKSLTKTCSIMISYSKENLEFTRELTEILLQIPDLILHVNFLNGKYFWKEIRQTINQSTIILFVLSNEFSMDKSCRQEFLYITDRLTDKLFFPIFLNQFYKPHNWIQKRIARLKSIRFTTQEYFLKHCEDLFELINENLSIEIRWKKSSSNIFQWNRNDIEQWFIKEKLSTYLYEFYHFENGKQLLSYAQATLAYSWTKEYERIQGRFHHHHHLSSDEFLKFIYALKRLPK